MTIYPFVFGTLIQKEKQITMDVRDERDRKRQRDSEAGSKSPEPIQSNQSIFRYITNDYIRTVSPNIIRETPPPFPASYVPVEREYPVQDEENQRIKTRLINKIENMERYILEFENSFPKEKVYREMYIPGTSIKNIDYNDMRRMYKHYLDITKQYRQLLLPKFKQLMKRVEPGQPYEIDENILFPDLLDLYKYNLLTMVRSTEEILDRRHTAHAKHMNSLSCLDQIRTYKLSIERIKKRRPEFENWVHDGDKNNRLFQEIQRNDAKVHSLLCAASRCMLESLQIYEKEDRS